MNPSFWQTPIEVWRQALVENARFVELEQKRQVYSLEGAEAVILISPLDKYLGLE